MRGGAAGGLLRVLFTVGRVDVYELEPLWPTWLAAIWRYRTGGHKAALVAELLSIAETLVQEVLAEDAGIAQPPLSIRSRRLFLLYPHRIPNFSM